MGKREIQEESKKNRIELVTIEWQFKEEGWVGWGAKSLNELQDMSYALVNIEVTKTEDTRLMRSKNSITASGAGKATFLEKESSRHLQVWFVQMALKILYKYFFFSSKRLNKFRVRFGGEKTPTTRGKTLYRIRPTPWDNSLWSSFN